MLFSLVLTDLLIFHSQTAEAIVHHTWSVYCKPRFYFDFGMQVAACVASMAVVSSSVEEKRLESTGSKVSAIDKAGHMRSHSPAFWMWLNIGFVFYFLLCSTVEMIRQYCYFKLTKLCRFFDPRFFFNIAVSDISFNALRFIEFAVYISTIISWFVDASDGGILSSDKNKTELGSDTAHYKGHYFYFACYTLFRWITLVLNFRSISRFSFTVIVILNLLASAGPWLLAVLSLFIIFFSSLGVTLNSGTAWRESTFLVHQAAILSNIDENSMDSNVNKKLMWAALVIVLLSVFFVGTVMIGILINIFLETYCSLKVDLQHHKRKHEAALCFKYLLAMQLSASFHGHHLTQEETELKDSYSENPSNNWTTVNNSTNTQKGKVNKVNVKKELSLNARDLSNEYYSQLNKDHEGKDAAIGQYTLVVKKRLRDEKDNVIYSLPLRNSLAAFMLSPLECILSSLFPSIFPLPPHQIDVRGRGGSSSYEADKGKYKLWLCTTTDDPYNLDYRDEKAMKKGKLGWTNLVSTEVIKKSSEDLMLKIDATKNKILDGFESVDEECAQLMDKINKTYAREIGPILVLNSKNVRARRS